MLHECDNEIPETGVHVDVLNSKTTEHDDPTNKFMSDDSGDEREDGEYEEGEIDDDENQMNSLTNPLPHNDENSPSAADEKPKVHRKRHRKKGGHRRARHHRHHGLDGAEEGEEEDENSRPPSTKKSRPNRTQPAWSDFDKDNGPAAVESVGAAMNNYPTSERSPVYYGSDTEGRPVPDYFYQSPLESKESSPVDYLSGNEEIDLHVATREKEGIYRPPDDPREIRAREKHRKVRRIKKSKEFFAKQQKREMMLQARRSEKEKQQHQPPKCKYYMEGRCGKADKCSFSHDFQPPKKQELCKFYAISTCLKGEHCIYLHGEFPCKFFHNGQCSHADNCKFSHDSLTPAKRNLLDRFLEDRPFLLDNDEEYDKPEFQPSDDRKTSLLGTPPKPLMYPTQQHPEEHDSRGDMSHSGSFDMTPMTSGGPPMSAPSHANAGSAPGGPPSFFDPMMTSQGPPMAPISMGVPRHQPMFHMRPGPGMRPPPMRGGPPQPSMFIPGRGGGGMMMGSGPQRPPMMQPLHMGRGMGGMGMRPSGPPPMPPPQGPPHTQPPRFGALLRPPPMGGLPPSQPPPLMPHGHAPPMRHPPPPGPYGGPPPPPMHFEFVNTQLDKMAALMMAGKSGPPTSTSPYSGPRPCPPPEVKDEPQSDPEFVAGSRLPIGADSGKRPPLLPAPIKLEPVEESVPPGAYVPPPSGETIVVPAVRLGSPSGSQCPDLSALNPQQAELYRKLITKPATNEATGTGNSCVTSSPNLASNTSANNSLPDSTELLKTMINISGIGGGGRGSESGQSIEELPWKLVPLDVPMKVPYPLMQLPGDLPHLFNDPRLKRQPVPPLRSNKDPRLQRTNSSGSGGSGEDSLTTIPTALLERPPPLKETKFESLESPKVESGVGGGSSLCELTSLDLNKDTTPTISVEPVSPIVSRAITTQVPIPALSQAQAPPPGPRPFKLELNEMANTFAHELPARQVSRDRSYLIDPRFRRRKVAAMTPGSNLDDAANCGGAGQDTESVSPGGSGVDSV